MIDLVICAIRLEHSYRTGCQQPCNWLPRFAPKARESAPPGSGNMLEHPGDFGGRILGDSTHHQLFRPPHCRPSQVNTFLNLQVTATGPEPPALAARQLEQDATAV